MGSRGIKLRLIISALLMAIIFVALIIAMRPVPSSVQIAFLGFTNNPPIPHVTYASFCVSNTGKCSMQGWGVFDFERKGWPRNPLRIQIEFPPSISELKPGEFKIISFRELPHTGPWRLALPLAKIEWRYRLQENWPRIFQKLPWHLRGQLGVRYQEYYSDWIITPESEANSIGTAKSTHFEQQPACSSGAPRKPTCAYLPASGINGALLLPLRSTRHRSLFRQ
jgi:hypothetical protein